MKLRHLTPAVFALLASTLPSVLRADTIYDRQANVSAIQSVHRAQLLTYLKLGNYPAGLLINFNVPVLKAGVMRVLNAAAPRRVVARAE